jgi:hypothetical protein
MTFSTVITNKSKMQVLIMRRNTEQVPLLRGSLTTEGRLGESIRMKGGTGLKRGVKTFHHSIDRLIKRI